ADLPVCVEAKSAGDFTNVNKRRKEEAQKMNQLKATFGGKLTYVLFLRGYFDAGYLGYEASEGIDWIWEHRADDLAGEIVSAALKFLPKGSDIRFLEPGLGTGAFFSALLRSADRHRIVAAKGVEIDPYYATAARDLWADTGLQVCIGDFTQMRPPGAESEKFNLLVCNPPYSRHH